MKKLQDFELEVREIRSKMIWDLPVKVSEEINCETAFSLIYMFKN